MSTGQDTNPVVLISFREPGLTFNTTLTAGSSTLGTSDREEDRMQFADTFTYLAGQHSLRFGFDYQRVDSTFIDLTDASGTYNFADPLATTTVPQCLDKSGCCRPAIRDSWRRKYVSTRLRRSLSP